MRLWPSLVALAVAVSLSACTSKKSEPPLTPSPAEAPAPAPVPVPVEPAAKPAEAEPPQAPDEGPLAWEIHSGDGAARLRQKPGGPGKCYLECTLGDGATAWKALAQCFGERSDRKFLADDCARTVVMIAAPPRSQAWRKTQVMRVYKKDKLDYPVMGIAALADEKLVKANPTWLKGCYGVAGEAPRYSKDGQAVEYETVDGKSHTVPLKK